MVKKLVGAAAMAAVALAVVPAHAAKMGTGCSGANFAKAESAVEVMADGDSKWGACGAHLSKAMQATMAK
jgi:hypothetical protein